MAKLHGFTSDGDYDGIVIGTAPYTATITHSEEKENSKKTGTYLVLVFTILEGPEKGGNVWVNLNLNNPSAVAVRISRSTLKDICNALGGVSPVDSSDLHDIPLVIHVDREKRADNGQMKNIITRYESTHAQAGQVATKATKAPWEEKD